MGTLKETIREANDRKSEIVHVDEWDVDVEVRALAGSDITLVWGQDEKDADTLRTALLVATCYDPATGERVFEDTSEDRELIQSKSAAATGRLVRVAMRLNGMTEEGRVDIKKD